jgi:hypothetical protein
MATGKTSFVLYCDLIHTVELLTDEQAGKLMKHLLQYVNDMDPETSDVVVRLAFEPIKRQLKRDLQAWEETREKRAESGRLGGLNSGKSRSKKQTKQMLQNRSKSKQNEANEAVTVNGNVNVTVDVNERERFTPSLDLELPVIKINSAIEYLSITKNINATSELVLSLWAFFKEKNFTGQKFYKSKQDAFSHFFETLKFEKIDGAHQQVLNGSKRKLGTSEGRIEGLKNW